MRPSPAMGNPAGIAIIGYGLAGSVFHGPLIGACPDLEVRALVTANPKRQEQARADFPEARIVPSAEDLWRGSGDVDCVVIATPNTLHAPLALAALERGLHVVVDKPMAPSVAEADAIIAAATAADRLLTVFQNRRWDNDFLLLRRLVAEDALGGIHRLESRYERFRPQVRGDAWREQATAEEGGGLLVDLGSHLIDQAMLLLGRPARVFAEVLRCRPGAAADDDSFLALEYEHQVRAHLWMSVLTPAIGPRLRAWGASHALEVCGLDPQESQLRAGRRPGMPGFGEAEPPQRAVLVGDGDQSGSGQALQLPAGAYADFYAGVAAALRGEAPVPVDPRDSRDVLAVIEAARASAAGGAAVAPAYAPSPVAGDH